MQDDGTFRVDAFQPLAASLNPHQLQNGQIHYPGYTSSTSYVAYLGDTPMPGNTECHATSSYSTMSVSNTRVITPLVLDLDGDGVELLSIESGVNFDINADGLMDTTAWVDRDDGLLVFDRNEDGLINDASELFGESSKLSNGGNADNGFVALNDLDSNQDGVFDKNDTHFEKIQVWQDPNSDGITQNGELLYLADIGLESINLEAQEVDEFHDAGVTGLRSFWTDTDGKSHNIDDVWLEVITGISDEEAIALGLGDLLDSTNEQRLELNNNQEVTPQAINHVEEPVTGEVLDLSAIIPLEQLSLAVDFY